MPHNIRCNNEPTFNFHCSLHISHQITEMPSHTGSISSHDLSVHLCSSLVICPGETDMDDSHGIKITDVLHNYNFPEVVPGLGNTSSTASAVREEIFKGVLHLGQSTRRTAVRLTICRIISDFVVVKCSYCCYHKLSK